MTVEELIHELSQCSPDSIVTDKDGNEIWRVFEEDGIVLLDN